MTVFPFCAIRGQDELCRALVLSLVDPGIGGVLALGDRGTGKSTTVRALGELCAAAGLEVPVVDLPLGATEEGVIGSLDIDAALTRGEERFRPGLLARADGGLLYVDEINLLEDHLVDVLLDVAASGLNIVERDGVSHTHPARFVLVGSGNPEEGELRPQLEDRFGLSVRVLTLADPVDRVEVISRRLHFGADPAGFAARWAEAQAALAGRIARARDGVHDVVLDRELLALIVRVCVGAGAIGHRGELVLAAAARASAALDGEKKVGRAHVRDCAPMVLRHRIPREPFEPPELIEERIGAVVAEALA